MGCSRMMICELLKMHANFPFNRLMSMYFFKMEWFMQSETGVSLPLGVIIMSSSVYQHVVIKMVAF